MAKARKRTSKPVKEHVETTTQAAEEAFPETPEPVSTGGFADFLASHDGATEPATPDTEARIETALQSAPVLRGSELKAPIIPDRDWTQFADPHPYHSVYWPDGYAITVQGSTSRGTVEIQFGDGSKKDQPENFEAIKPVLMKNGLKWNGQCAWQVELQPPPKYRRESLPERIERIEANKALRARIEDEVFPAVIALEEEKRGQIELTDDSRSRINKAAEAWSR